MKTYLITVTPKKGWREFLNFYVKLVEANSAADALCLVPSAWPVGSGRYLKPQAREFTPGTETTL